MGNFHYTDDFQTQSSVIDRAWYDRTTETMAVRLNNGTVCAYAGVPLDSFFSFAKSVSHGAHWNRWIKNHYAGISSADFNNFILRETSPVETQEEGFNWDVVVSISGKATVPVDARDASSAIQKAVEQFKVFGIDARVVSVSERD